MAKKMYVGNLNYETNEDQLNDVFKEYGEVVSVNIIADKFSGKSRGFAFVEMANDEEADSAMAGLNGKEIDGRNIKVNEARRRENNPRRGGGRGDRGDRGDFHNHRRY